MVIKRMFERLLTSHLEKAPKSHNNQEISSISQTTRSRLIGLSSTILVAALSSCGPGPEPFEEEPEYQHNLTVSVDSFSLIQPVEEACEAWRYEGVKCDLNNNQDDPDIEIVTVEGPCEYVDEFYILARADIDNRRINVYQSCMDANSEGGKLPKLLAHELGHLLRGDEYHISLSCTTAQPEFQEQLIVDENGAICGVAIMVRHIDYITEFETKNDHRFLQYRNRTKSVLDYRSRCKANIMGNIEPPTVDVYGSGIWFIKGYTEGSTATQAYPEGGEIIFNEGTLVVKSNTQTGKEARIDNLPEGMQCWPALCDDQGSISDCFSTCNFKPLPNGQCSLPAQGEESVANALIAVWSIGN